MTVIGLNPYLMLSGRCEEAIEFYQSALHAQVEILMRFHESPDPPPPGVLQPGFENKVMHASLRIGEELLMMSDGCDDTGSLSGVSLSLLWSSEAEARQAFAALSVGGTVTMPLEKTFWSPCFGMVTDQFGVAWMISIPPETT